MLDEAMPGEALTANGSPAGNAKSSSFNYENTTLQEMAERLEKSEAARKKFRQVTLLLKEKLDATEQVLQVNDTLRQECEKERKRAEAERNRAEEEKKLRQKIEKEGLSTKEQLVLVLKRLDAVERDCKSDRNEVERMRQEVKQAVSALSGAVTVIEAANVSFQNLEKNILGKPGLQINNAMSTSTKALSLAQSAISDAKGAQGTASLAEKLSQSLDSRVAVLQKQGTSLDQRLNILQQELRTKLLESKCDGKKFNDDRSANGRPSGVEQRSPLNRGMVMSKSQQPTGACLNSPKLVNKEPGQIEALVDSTPNSLNSIKPSSGDYVAGCGTPSPRDGRWTTANVLTGSEVLKETHINNQTRRPVVKATTVCKANGDVSVDGDISQDKRHPDACSRNIIREALAAAKLKGNLSRSKSMTKCAPKPEITACIQGNNSERFPNGVAPLPKNQRCIKHQQLAARIKKGDSGNGSMPAYVRADKDEPAQNNSSVPFTESILLDGIENRSYLEAPIMNSGCSVAEESGVKSNVLIVNPLPLVSAQADKRTGSFKGTLETRAKVFKEKMPASLLKDISKLFQKEKKSHAKIEDKLATLQRVLQSGCNEVVDGDFPDSLEKSASKRKRIKSLLVKSRKKVCRQDAEDGLNSTLQRVMVVDCKVGEMATESCGVEEGKQRSNSSVVEKDLASYEDDQQYLLYDKGKENIHLAGPQVGLLPVLSHSDALREPQELQGCTEQEERLDADSYLSRDDKLNGGWDSESLTSDDSLDDDWWEKKGALLSPNLPIVACPSSPLVDLPVSNFDSTWPATGKMSPEEISHFLDFLPPISNGTEVCDEIVIDEAVTKAQEAKDGIEGSCTQSLESISSKDAKDLSTVLSCQIKEELKEKIEGTQSVEAFLCGDNAKALCTTVDCEITEVTDSLNRSQACRENSSETVLKKHQDCDSEEMEKKVVLMEELSSEGTTAFVQVQSSAIFPSESAFYSGKPMGLSSTVAQVSRAGTHPKMGSQCKFNSDAHSGGFIPANQCEELWGPFSLDFICDELTVDSKANSTDYVAEDGSRPSAIVRSRMIMVALEMARKILCGALNQTISALASTAAAEMTSVFLDTTFSRGDLICIFTASLVDAYAMWDSEMRTASLTSESRTLQLLLNTFIKELVMKGFQNALPLDQAFSVVADQLQKFLIRGHIQPCCWLNPEEDLKEGNALRCAFHFTAPTSEEKKYRALISGSKLLASFCKTNGKLDFLRNSIYLILRFCDKDSLWLLAAMSSFALVCGKSLFAIDNGDIVGQAVFVIISELLNDAEAGRESICQGESQNGCSEVAVKVQVEVQQASQNITKATSDFMQCPGNLDLKEIIGDESGLSFEVFVPKILMSFHNVISPTFDCNLQANQHILLRSLQTSEWELSESNSDTGTGFRPFTSTDSPSSGTAGSQRNETNLKRRYCWRFIDGCKSHRECTTLASRNQLVQDSRYIYEWRETFHDLVNALELVASHLGWEWTYNDLIVEHLWKLVTPGAPAMTVTCVAHVFGVLGRLGREIDGAELPGVDELRKSLLVVLSSDPSGLSVGGSSHHSFSFVSQAAAAEALLFLSNMNGNPGSNHYRPEGPVMVSSQIQAESVKSLQSWFQALRPEMQEVLPSSLKCAFFSPEKGNLKS